VFSECVLRLSCSRQSLNVLFTLPQEFRNLLEISEHGQWCRELYVASMQGREYLKSGYLSISHAAHTTQRSICTGFRGATRSSSTNILNLPTLTHNNNTYFSSYGIRFFTSFHTERTQHYCTALVM